MSESACPCGHPWPEHGHVKGFNRSDGERVPDVWVCGGGRLADINAADWSPWDHVCGCLIRADEAQLATPQGEFVRGQVAERTLQLLRYGTDKEWEIGELLAVEGKDGCQDPRCRRVMGEPGCRGWHCPTCGEPCSSQGHRCQESA